jgi:hypothetical protein
VGEVDDEELAMVLTSVLPRGAQLSANEVEYRTSEDEWVLSLRYSEGLVVDAVMGPAFTPAIGEQIRQALADALDGTTKKVWRVPMFSLRALRAGTGTRMTSSSDPHPRRRLARMRNTPNIRGCWSFRSSTRLTSKSVTCERRGAPTNWP